MLTKRQIRTILCSSTLTEHPDGIEKFLLPIPIATADGDITLDDQVVLIDWIRDVLPPDLIRVVYVNEPQKNTIVFEWMEAGAKGIPPEERMSVLEKRIKATGIGSSWPADKYGEPDLQQYYSKLRWAAGNKTTLRGM